MNKTKIPLSNENKNLMTTIGWLVFSCIFIARPSIQYFSNYRYYGVGFENTSSVILIISLFLIVFIRGYWIKLLYDIHFYIFTILILILFISLLFSKKFDLISSLTSIVRFFTYLIVYIYSRYAIYDKKWSTILSILVLSSIIPIIYGYTQLFTETLHTMRGVKSVYGTFGHPNMFGNFLVFVNLTTLYLIYSETNNYKKFSLLIYFIICFFLLLNCYGRAVLLSFIFLSLIFVIAFLRKYIIIYLSGMIFVWIFKYDIISNYIFRFTTLDQAGTHLSNRTKIWSSMYELIKYNSLVGIGPQNWFPHYSDMNAHNEFLKYFLETGIVGGFLFIVLFVITIYRILQSYSFYKFPPEKVLMILIVVANLFLMLTSNLGTNISLQWSFWALFGSYCGIVNREKNFNRSIEFSACTTE